MSEDLWYQTCLRCGGEMEQGFALDEGQSGMKQGRWVAGRPRKSIWTGLKLGGKRKLPVSAYRCMNCGFLDLYANEKRD